MYLEVVESHSRGVRRKSKTEENLLCIYTHGACAKIKVEDKSWAIHFKSPTGEKQLGPDKNPYAT